MAYGVYVTYTVTDPTVRNYDTGRPYLVGSNTLFVYINGLLATVGQHYIELDTKTIQFRDDLDAGDNILITSSFINRDLQLDFALIGNRSNSLFKRYDDKQHLLPNQTYEMELVIGEQVFKYTFTSKYSPMFSTEKIVRMDLGDVIEEIKSDVVNFTIWQNSKIAIELTDSSGDYQYYSNAEDIDLKSVPFYAKQWVRYKTELDLLNAVYLNIAGNSGRSKKKLGNLEIEKEYSIPYLSDLLKEVKAKLAPFEKLLTGVKVVGKATKKAGSTTYPLSDRRSF